eukprot:s2136_g9.t1
MATYKANFFHWHLTDDQSWRLFLRSRPKLVKSSQYTSPESYSEEDVQQVLSFAREHFVTVVPVIETPGHILAALAAYPELACKGKHFEVPKQRLGTYTDILCVGKATTFEFAKDVFTDVARLFPSRWIHVGGDEVPFEKWWMSEHVRAFAGMAGLRNIPVDMMDARPKNRMDYPVGDTTGVAEDFPFASISSPVKSVYLDYPVASIDFNRSTQLLPLTGPRILGGCATMWTEDACSHGAGGGKSWVREFSERDSEPKDVFTKVFPRFMAISERLWGGFVTDLPRSLDLSLWWAAHRHCERFATVDVPSTSYGVTCGRFEVKTGARSPMFARARITTSLDNFGDAFQVGQAFDDDPETYFWAVSPQAGDMIEVAFLEGRRRKASLGKWLKQLVVKTGSKDRPSDQLEQGQLKVAQWQADDGGTWSLKWRAICAFKAGECHGDAETLMQGPIVHIRLSVMATQTKWMALPEFEVEEAQEHPEHPTAQDIEDATPGASKSHLSRLVSNVWESLAGDAATAAVESSTSKALERRHPPSHALRHPPHNVTRRGPMSPRAPRNVTRRGMRPPRPNETTKEKYIRALEARRERQRLTVMKARRSARVAHGQPPAKKGRCDAESSGGSDEGETNGDAESGEEISEGDGDRQLSTEFKREISVLLRLRHPNLVLFMGACTKAPQALIISEFCAGGTIFALLHQRKDLQLPWGQRLQVALDVAKGMNFLHRRQVVHRDLKSLNLLLTAPLRSNEDIPAVKVSDFGLSRAFPSAPQQVCMTSGAGTYHWMAPEVLSGQSYDEKVDVYSYGICLYELITRRIPYDTSGLEPVSIAVAVSRGKRPDPKVVPQDCPADLRFTMKCCWAHRPSGRPGFDTILETLKLVKGCRSQQNL